MVWQPPGAANGRLRIAALTGEWRSHIGVEAGRATQKSTLSIFNGHASSGGGGGRRDGGGRFVFLSSLSVTVRAEPPPPLSRPHPPPCVSPARLATFYSSTKQSQSEQHGHGWQCPKTADPGSRPSGLLRHRAHFRKGQFRCRQAGQTPHNQDGGECLGELVSPYANLGYCSAELHNFCSLVDTPDIWRRCRNAVHITR